MMLVQIAGFQKEFRGDPPYWTVTLLDSARKKITFSTRYYSS